MDTVTERVSAMTPKKSTELGWLQAVTRVSGALAAGLGVAAWIGWISGTSLLAAMGAGNIPMAPSTASLLSLLGVLTALGSAPRYRKIGPLIGSIITIVAAFLLVLSLVGVLLPAEHLGLPISGTVGGAPLGHMSPITAGIFVLAGLTYLLIHLAPAAQVRLIKMALALSWLLMLTSIVLITAYLLGGPLFYDTGVIPPALNTSLGFLLLGVGLMACAGHSLRVREEAEGDHAPRPPYGLLAIFALVALIIVGVAYVYFRAFEREFRHGIESELTAVADLKVNELALWRRERIADGNVFYRNANYADLVKRYLQRPEDPELSERLWIWLDKLRTAYDYQQVALLDAQGALMQISPSQDEPVSPHLVETARDVLAAQEIAFVDFHRHASDGPVILSVLVPILDPLKETTGLGVLVIETNPDRYLYPMIQRWPTGRTTAETLLVRREGDHVLFLNDLRYHEDAALRLTVPLTQEDLPAAMALRDVEGVVEGLDYRGVPVAAAVRRVPDSPWALVAKIDTAEIYAPLRQRLWLVLGIVGLLLAGTGGAAGVVWQRRDRSHYRALYEAEMRYGTTLQSIGDGVIATDERGRIVLLNAVAESLTGWTAQDARGRPLTEVFVIINETSRQAVANPVSRVLSEGTIVGLANHTLLLARDGREIPIADSGAPIADPDGNLTGVVLVFRDQTEEREAQRRLERERARAQRYLDTAGVIMIALDRSGEITMINRRGCDVLGYEEDELIGRNWYDLCLPQEEADQVRDSLTRLVDGAVSSGEVMQNHVLTHQGERRLVDWRNTVVRDESGTVTGILSSGEDVTERAAAEAERQALLELNREQAQQITQIIETVPQGVLLLDAQGHIELTNPVAASQLSLLADIDIYSRDGVQQLSAVSDHGSAVDPPRLSKLGDRPLTELLTSPPKGVWHDVHAEGRTFEVIARPLANGADPERWVLVIQDVTEERQVRERLQLQERLAAVGQLAAGIAHDFNNIMGVIVLHAQMAARSEHISARNRERLETIDQQAHHAAQLIEQILDFSRRGLLARRPLDLLPLIKEQVRLLKRTLPENIAVELDFARGAYSVNADPTRMQQIIMNLAVNARDAMPQGGTLRIALDRLHLDRHASPPVARMVPGDWITISVTDTGTGIATEALPHIFEPFYTTKPPGQGSGLGLAQVHGIIAQHEGHIDVDTEPNRGTTFTIYLPASSASPNAVLEPAQGETPRGQGQVVLVVEDNAVLRRALCETLVDNGYQVREASDGLAALALLGEEDIHVDLVLSDVVMPRMGGLALANALRERGWAIPVILMSGHPRQRNLDELLAQGVADWLPKPPNLDDLARAVDAAFRSRR